MRRYLKTVRQLKAHRKRSFLCWIPFKQSNLGPFWKRWWPIYPFHIRRLKEAMIGWVAYFLANNKGGDSNGQPYDQDYAVHLFVSFK